MLQKHTCASATQLRAYAHQHKHWASASYSHTTWNMMGVTYVIDVRTYIHASYSGVRATVAKDKSNKMQQGHAKDAKHNAMLPIQSCALQFWCYDIQSTRGPRARLSICIHHPALDFCSIQNNKTHEPKIIILGSTSRKRTGRGKRWWGVPCICAGHETFTLSQLFLKATPDQVSLHGKLFYAK